MKKTSKIVHIYIIQFLKLISAVVSTMILARLIPPVEFKYFAISSIYIYAFFPLRDGGFSNIVLQEQSLTKELFTSISLMTLLYGVFLSLFVSLIAFFTQWYFKYSLEIRNCIIFMSTSFVVYSLYIQTHMLLRKQSRNYPVEVIYITSQLLALCVAIILCYYEFSYWALAFQVVAYELFVFLLTIRFYNINDYSFSRIQIDRKIVSNSFHSLQSVFVLSISDYLDRIVLSFLSYGLAISYYTKGKQLLKMPRRLFILPLRGIIIPKLARSNDFLETYLGYLLLIILVPCTMMFICTFNSTGFIRIVLGEAWVDASIILSLLSVSFAFEYIHQTLFPFLIGSSSYKKLSSYSYLSTLISIVLVVFGALFDTYGVIYAVVASSVLKAFITVLFFVQKYKRDGTSYKSLVMSFAFSFIGTPVICACINQIFKEVGEVGCFILSTITVYSFVILIFHKNLLAIKKSLSTA